MTGNGETKSHGFVWRSAHPRTQREVRVVSFATFLTTCISIAGMAGALVTGVYGMSRGAAMERRILAIDLKADWSKALDDRQRTADETHKRLDVRIDGVSTRIEDVSKRLQSHEDRARH